MMLDGFTSRWTTPSHPDFELLEPLLQLLLETPKEISIPFVVSDIHENAHQFIAIGLALTLPYAVNDLGLGGYGAEALFELEQRLSDQLIGNCLAVIEAMRQQDFVTALQAALKWRGLQLRRGCLPEQGRRRAPGGTIMSPLAQLLKENRPAKNPSARLLAASSRKRIIIILSSYPKCVDARRIALWAQVITGIEADEHGNARALGADEWQRRKKRLADLGGSPVLD